MGWERVRGRGKENTHARTRHARSATHTRKHTQCHVRNATNTDAACAVRWGLAWKCMSLLHHPPPFPPPSRQFRVQAAVGKGVVGSSEHDIFFLHKNAPFLCKFEYPT